jgi:hypothetical protein
MRTTFEDFDPNVKWLHAAMAREIQQSEIEKAAPLAYSLALRFQ